MPLRSASGSEAQAYLDIGQLSDSALLLGLSEYFRAIAVVESVDPRKPDADRLRSASGHLGAARDHLATSNDAGRKMLAHVPSTSKEAGDFFRLRVDSSIQMTQAFESVIGKMHAELSSGRYPQMASCAEAATLLGDLFGRFRENAQFHGFEGF